MLDKPFGRRTLLRGAGVLGAASLAGWPAGCGTEDHALTFFFAANPEEADARMRIIEAFQPGIPTSRYGRYCPGRARCSRYRRFAPAASAQMC